MAGSGGILFTAFEPSGDVLAAKLIGSLVEREPGRPIYAFGGEAMARAGAQLIENTTQHAAMLGDAVRQAVAHKRRLARIGRWMADHPLDLAIPTDSPAANWGVCSLVRRHHPRAKIVHLAAPQLWAWASWRIGKMRRLSDHVMCLLPFEPAWFERRGMPASFVSHPVFDAVSPTPAEQLGEPVTHLALLPGSRRKEIERNWPTMHAVWRELRAADPQLTATAAVRDNAAAQWLHEAQPRSDEPDPRLGVAMGRTPQVIAEAQVVLTVSGTATLQVLAARRPMVAMYNTSAVTWHGVGRWVIATRTFTLPNLISESMGMGRVIDEWVPHFGQVTPVAESVTRLVSDASARQGQVQAFDRIRTAFEQVRFTEAATRTVQAQLRGD